MLVNSLRDVLKAFGDGHIGWREACRKLDLETFGELDTLMKEHKIPLYQPDPKESAKRMQALDALLYGKDEL
jgi:hypothetical protein